MKIFFGFAPSSDFANLSWVRLRYDNTGPTIFKVYNILGEVDIKTLTMDFSPTDTQGVYRFTSSFLMVPNPADPPPLPITPLALRFHGLARESAPDPDLVGWIEGSLAETGEYPNGLRYLVPTPNVIPEPSSLALMAFGAAGLARAGRRRKPSRTATAAA